MIKKFIEYIKEEDNFEIGDEKFPLYINKEHDIDRSHKMVGKEIMVNKHANEVLSDKHGEKGHITGVIIKSEQIAGFEVLLKDDKTYYAPKKDFFIEGGKQMSEDVYLHSSDSMTLRKTLEHWNTQRDYIGREWDGVEYICFELARYSKKVAIQSAGWYKYEGSLRDDMDGKDWRYVTLDGDTTVSINCHSLLHDNTWSLSTTIHDTKQIDTSKLKEITHEDLWKRSMLYSIETAKVLATDGYTYTEVIEEMEDRLSKVDELHKMKNDIIKKVNSAYNKHFGEKNDIPNEVTICLSQWAIPTNKIAMYEKDSVNNIGYINIKPSALDDKEYLKWIITHELIHAAFKGNSGHALKFNIMADELELPKEYRN